MLPREKKAAESYESIATAMPYAARCLRMRGDREVAAMRTIRSAYGRQGAAGHDPSVLAGLVASAAPRAIAGWATPSRRGFVFDERVPSALRPVETSSGRLLRDSLQGAQPSTERTYSGAIWPQDVLQAAVIVAVGLDWTSFDPGSNSELD